mgnify:CR=1 FL=1
MNQNNIQIIGQGTYGCVYRPNIDCQTKKIDSKQFLSKIQRKDKTSKNEIVIGKKIISLPKNIYSNRFAPILESCPIEIGKMEEQQFSTCKMIVQGKEKIKKTGLLSNKIQYVGEQTLGDYLESELTTKDNATQYIKKVAESHLYLLKSLEILNQTNVLHLDLKHNNIMFDKNKGFPIIIDFGLSYNSENLEMSKYKVQEHKFGIMTDFYIPWTIETVMLSHIAKHLSSKSNQTVDEAKLDDKITNIKMLESIVKNYVKKHGLLQSRKIFTGEEVDQYEKGLLQWVSSFKDKTWRTLWTSLCSSNKTWDTYSLSILYLIELQLAGLIQLSKKEDNTFLTKYMELLKQSILTKPEERLLPSDIRKKLYIIFTQVNKMDYNQVVKQISRSVQENKAKIVKNRAKENLQTLQEEKQIHDKFNAH